MLVRKGSRPVPGSLAGALMLLALPAASAGAAVGHRPTASGARSSAIAPTARIRFLAAAPGQPTQGLAIVSGGLTTSAGGRAAYGQLTPYASAPAGMAQLDLGRRIHLSTRLTPGSRYTVVATAPGGRLRLRSFRDGNARPGSARLRVVHVAPELGAPDVRLGGRVIAQAIGFGRDTGYIDVTPGSYSEAVTAPRGGSAIVSRRLTLQAGTATTSFVIGTGGAKESIVVGADQTASPGGPPQTGLGGLATGGAPRWSLIGLGALCGALLAACLSGAVQRRRGV